MELRVWVDGTQRVVCGVKLTTTCQEIVFALAHATQQAGRFTMIERWRNIERLLSPNEQPLVTLQRWGDRMNEVEFILKRNSAQIAPTTTNQLQQQQQPQQSQQSQPLQQPQPQQSQQGPLQQLNHNQIQPSQTVVHDNGRQASPCNSLNSNPPSQSFEDMYTNQRYNNLTRRPQTVLGPLTSANSTAALRTPPQAFLRPLARLPDDFRTSLSATTLPCATPNNMTASPSLYRNSVHNGYQQQIKSEIIAQPQLQLQPQQQQQQQQQQIHQPQQPLSINQPQAVNLAPKNFPYEDLYGTINKRRTSQPPAVPAKPHVSQIASASNISLPSTVNDAQLNYYHPNGSPFGNQLYQNNVRPHHPPGYLDYLESITRSPTQMLANQQQRNNFAIGNMQLQPSLDSQNLYQNPCSSVSKLGHDMLKVIEEQKRVLMNQKSEIDRLDNDQDYRLVSRVENEIQQLEELWKENQDQIAKLESHDFEKELVELEDEKIKMESDIKECKEKMAKCEIELIARKKEIEQLESEIAKKESEQQVVEDVVESYNKEREKEDEKSEMKPSQVQEHPEKASTNNLQPLLTKVSSTNGFRDTNEVTGSDNEEDCENDSEPEATDDTNHIRRNNVEKRGLINGIRSLKIDKSSAFSRRTDSYRSSAENLTSSSVISKDKTPAANPNRANNLSDKLCSETNGLFSEDNTAINNNQYEFLMTL